MVDEAQGRGVPWFAGLYDLFMRPLERRMLGALRARLLEGAHGDALEVGTGTGANFPLLAAQPIRLTATEPDPHMLARARRRAAATGLDARFVMAPAEDLPFEDGAFDLVVMTLVLCSVADPARSLAEIRRVLKPGGELRFLEHVRAEGLVGRAQDWLRPAWAVIGAGCQLNRRSAELVRAAGFEDLRFEATPAPFPIGKIVVGRARRP